MSEEIKTEVLEPSFTPWYEQLTYDDAKTLIRSNIVAAAREFVTIGYYLKYVRDSKLYCKDNYTNIWEFAQEEFGISKSTASRYMKMNDRFSRGGNSPILESKYREFEKSKLQEMLYLSDEQMELVNPGMRVQEIRALRQPKEVPYYEMEGQMELVADFPEVVPEAVEDSTITVESPPCQEQPMPVEEVPEGDSPQQQAERSDDLDGVAISQQMETQDSMIIQKLFIAAWSEHCPQDFERAMRAMKKGKSTGEKAKKIQEELAQYGCHEILCQEYEFSFHGFKEGMDWRVGDEQIHLEYRRLASELLCMCDPLDDCTLADDEKQVETVSEPIEYDRNVLEKMIQDAKGTLDAMKESWLKEKPYIYAKYSMMVQAYEMLLQAQDAVDQQPEIEVVEQTELPLLKNNEQRAAFIDAYETWPVWIDNQETGERYYRYDLPDGTSFVVKTYHMLALRGWTGESGRHYEEGWGCDEQYILEPGKFFKNCWSNRSAMIEKLKEIQKGEK